MISDWDKLINRIVQETSRRTNNHKTSEIRDSSLVMIKAVIFVDCNGTPVHWIIDSNTVEPASRAKGLIDILT